MTNLTLEPLVLFALEITKFDCTIQTLVEKISRLQIGNYPSQMKIVRLVETNNILSAYNKLWRTKQKIMS